MNRLLVIRGNPLEVLPELFEDWKVTRLAFEVDTEPYALTRDSEVENLCREHHVEIMKKISHTLYDSDRLEEKIQLYSSADFVSRITHYSQINKYMY